MLIGAAVRAAQMTGALETVLDLSVRYATERIAFGRPIAKFQAVQQSLAILAVEAAAVNSAGAGAALALDHGDAMFEIAAAKLRTNQAIGIGPAIYEVLVPAIGMNVQKRGRTTELTTNGQITSVGGTFNVTYRNQTRLGRIANSFIVTSTDGNVFSAAGDSGSTKRPVSASFRRQRNSSKMPR